MSDHSEATATHPIGVRARSRPSAGTLHVVFPRELAAQIPLRRQPMVIGRAEKATCHIHHASVSRRHLAVAWDTDRQCHAVVELGSRNGSRIDGQRINPESEPVPLSDGSVVRVGSVIFVYESQVLPEGHRGGSQVDCDAVPGSAVAIHALRDAMAAAGPDPAPVLLQGETGTGKEFVARELHRLSRRSGALVPVNCAALSATLVESQLFGHQKGAFTGADMTQQGMFQAAHGGTIFLDEIGELPLSVQPKLLRVLQEREVLPVGATQPVPIDVRVISATLRDLRAFCGTGEFRLDLYARISPITIAVPALRQRRCDILSWIERLHGIWYRTRGSDTFDPPRHEADAVERLLLHRWPENLRGIERVVQHGCGRNVWPYDVPEDSVDAASDTSSDTDHANGESVAAPTSPAALKGKRRARPTKADLTQVLEEVGWSVRAAAKRLGRERRQIYRWMERYGLRGGS